MCKEMTLVKLKKLHIKRANQLWYQTVKAQPNPKSKDLNVQPNQRIRPHRQPKPLDLQHTLLSTAPNPKHPSSPAHQRLRTHPETYTTYASTVWALLSNNTVSCSPGLRPWHLSLCIAWYWDDLNHNATYIRGWALSSTGLRWEFYTIKLMLVMLPMSPHLIRPRWWRRLLSARICVSVK